MKNLTKNILLLSLLTFSFNVNSQDLSFNGGEYYGEVKNGKMNGFGTFSYSSDNKQLSYRGYFVNNLKHGQGVLIYKAGEVYEGLWHEGWLVDGHYTDRSGKIHRVLKTNKTTNTTNKRTQTSRKISKPVVKKQCHKFYKNVEASYQGCSGNSERMINNARTSAKVFCGNSVNWSKTHFDCSNEGSFVTVSGEIFCDCK